MISSTLHHKYVSMQFLTNVPDLQKVCQNLDPPKRVACCSHASCCVVVWGTCTVENLRELGRQRRRRRRHAIVLPPQSVFAATEAGDYYSRRTSLAKKVLRLSFA